MQENLWGRLRRMHLQSHQVRGFTLLSPTLGFMVLFLGLPIVILLVLSFWTQTYIDFNKTFSLANYQKFFSRPIYSFLLGKSIVISLCVTIATVLIAYPMAYFLAFRTQGNKLFWIVLVTLPFWTSYLLRVFAWKIILGYNGVINSGFISLGLIKEPLLFLLYNPGAVIITLAHAWGAFAILPLYVSLEKIDRSLLEAATDLGDSLVSRFFRITLPLSMPGVIAATIFVFIPTVGDYVTPNLVGGTNGIMIGNIIQSQFGKANNWPMGAALALISMAAIAIIVLLYLWCIKLLKKRI